MTAALGGFGEPGVGTAITTLERNILWGGSTANTHCLERQSASTATDLVDAGSTPTSVIRPGNLLAYDTSAGTVKMWDADDFTNPGVKDLYGVLANEIRVADPYGTAVARRPRVLVRGPVKASQLLISGSALVGHAQEYVARRQLRDMGFMLDDDLSGHLAGFGNRQVIESAASTTVTAAQNGVEFVATGSGSNFTLPTIKAGLRYRFFNAVDQNMVITSAAGNDIIAKHDTAASTITFSTSSNKIGACVEVECRYTAAATLSWFARFLCTNTATIA